MLSFLQKHPQLLQHLHKSGDQLQKNVQREMQVPYIGTGPARDGRNSLLTRETWYYIHIKTLQ